MIYFNSNIFIYELIYEKTIKDVKKADLSYSGCKPLQRA